MIKRALMGAFAVLVVACNPGGPIQTADNAVGGPTIVSTTQAKLAPATTSLSLDWGKKAQAGQVAIADVLTYGGQKVTIAAPAGWQKIREDSTSTTRQSLYWHAVQANDPSAATWTFSAPVDARGAIVPHITTDPMTWREKNKVLNSGQCPHCNFEMFSGV